ncbi:MAG: hypothetical protein QOI80_1048, partial [Solirubrobacteraceae bacterium]|nr:hypothetical protein [Solirubrobacteraceae bacterium]
MVRISVIVPVFNPGRYIDELIQAVLAQSLPTSEYEVIFVDDGSTDGTAERLDQLEKGHANVKVRHQPNSGRPGRPRNVGTDLARGEYVFYADNDDWLARDALERLVRRADRDQADVVVGKVVGHGRTVPLQLFAASGRELSLAWAPLLQLLTPHKLFRRSFLNANGIRFPEGRRGLEDHAFVMQAYLATQRISVLADRPCYHWALRSADANASAAPFDPEHYFAGVRDVLDIVDAGADSESDRHRLLAHWYRSKVLGQLHGRTVARRDPDHNAHVF